MFILALSHTLRIKRKEKRKRRKREGKGGEGGERRGGKGKEGREGKEEGRVFQGRGEYNWPWALYHPIHFLSSTTHTQRRPQGMPLPTLTDSPELPPQPWHLKAYPILVKPPYDWEGCLTPGLWETPRLAPAPCPLYSPSAVRLPTTQLSLPSLSGCGFTQTFFWISQACLSH